MGSSSVFLLGRVEVTSDCLLWPTIIYADQLL